MIAALNLDEEHGRNVILQKQSFDSLMRCIDSADSIIGDRDIATQRHRDITIKPKQFA